MDDLNDLEVGAVDYDDYDYDDYDEPEEEDDPAMIRQDPIDGCDEDYMSEGKQMDIHLRDIKLAKPATATLEKAKAILYGPLRDQAREAKNVSSWVAVGPYSESAQISRICHAAMYHVKERRAIPAARTKKGKYRTRKGKQLISRMDKRPQYRYLVNYTCHACKPEYWSKYPESHVPFDGKRLRAVMAWYDFLANRSHWARFFVGPKDMFTMLHYGHILDLSAPSFVVHFMCVAWRMPGEFIEQVESWFELVERGIDPHMAFGAAMCLGFEDGKIESIRTKGHSLMGTPDITTIARFVKGVAICTKAELAPSWDYYTTSCNQAYGYRYGGSWMEEAKKIDALCTIVETPTPWGGTNTSRKFNPETFRTVFDPGWQWMMRRVMETIALHKW